MSLLWIFLAIFGLAAPETFAEPPSTSEAAAVAPSTDEVEVRANIKQIVNAIEACATVRVDGTYRDTGTRASAGPDCLSRAAIVDTEPALAQLELVDPPAKPGVDEYQVAPVGDGAMGFEVTGLIQDGDAVLAFAERHSPDGSVEKTCGATVGGPEGSLRCPDGW